MTGKSSCSECPSNFELIPPADKSYSEPKEKPESDDHLKRIYECDDEGHRNTIYWHKKKVHARIVVSKGFDVNKELENY